MQQLQKPKQGYKIVTLRPRYRKLEIPIDWKIAELSDLCTLVNGMAFKPEDWKKEGFPIIRIQNLNNKEADFNYYDAPVEEKYYVNDGDILFGWSGNLGTSFGAHIWKNGKAILNQHIFNVISNDSVTTNFLFHMLNRLVKEIELETHGSIGLVHVKKGYMESRLIPLPPKIEQQKISTILSNIDSLIQQTQKEMELTQKLKKGLMQRLLIKGIGHTKFKSVNLGLGFLKRKIPVSWNVKKINEISEVVRGGSPRPAGDPKYFGGIIPWITVGEITKDDNMYLDSVHDGLTEEGKEHSRFLEKGTFIIANSGATLGVPKIMKISGCANDGVAAVLNLRELIPEYLYYLIYSWINLLRNINQGMGQPNLNTTIIGNIEVPCPPIIEQQKILQILWNIDSQIQKQQEYESTLKTIKKGLMQKLLTGQIRVKV